MTIYQMTYDQAIEKVGYGKFQRKLMLICGLGWAADAMEVLLISFAMPAIAQEWGLNPTQKGWLGTAVFIGMLLGSIVWGRVIDRFGRKVGFISTIAIDSIFGLLSAFSPSFVWLLVLRALTGFGVGGTLPVDYSMFAEYLPVEKRGRKLVLLESFWALGVLIAAGLAWLIVPNLGWRWLLGISAIPGIIIFFIRRYIPESPRYLLIKGEAKKAAEILTRVADENGTSLGEFSLQPLGITKKTNLWDLFHPKLRRTTILLWGIWFLISLGYYGVFTWLPNYFRSTGMEMLPVYQTSFILAIAQLPGYFSAAYLIEKWGRKKTLGFYLLASGCFTLLFSFANGLSWMVFLGIWMSFFTLGAWGALYAYTPEAYPTILRGTGMGAASAMTRFAGAIAPNLGALLLLSTFTAPLATFSSAFVLAGIFAIFLGRETRQTSLQDSL